MIKKLIHLSILTIFSLSVQAQNDGYVNTPDSKIYYQVFGTGKPLVIINGGPGMNSNGFIEMAKILSRNYQTILYDQRGTGKSVLQTINSSTVKIQLMAEDLEYLRKHLNIQKWSVLGHSFGGMLASYYATLFPERIDKLILSSSVVIDLELLNYVNKNIRSKLSKTEQDSLNYWNNKINRGDISYHAHLQRGMYLAPAYLYNRTYIPVIAKRLTETNFLINDLIWKDMQKIKFDCSDKLTNFKNPVLIIQGKQDIIEEKTALKAAKVLPNSRIVLIDNCVHYGWLDAPKQYFGEIDSFLKD